MFKKSWVPSINVTNREKIGVSNCERNTSIPNGRYSIRNERIATYSQETSKIRMSDHQTLWPHPVERLLLYACHGYSHLKWNIQKSQYAEIDGQMSMIETYLNCRNSFWHLLLTLGINYQIWLFSFYNACKRCTFPPVWKIKTRHFLIHFIHKSGRLIHSILPLTFDKPRESFQAHYLWEMLCVDILCSELHFDKTKMTLQPSPLEQYLKMIEKEARIFNRIAWI